MVQSSIALEMPVLKIEFELPASSNQSKYETYSQVQLAEEFCEAFDEVFPLGDLPEFGRPTATGETEIPISSNPEPLKLTRSALTYLSIASGLGTTVGRELIVPAPVLARGALGQAPGLGRIPIHFSSNGNYIHDTEQWINQSVGLAYGENGVFGIADMRDDVSKRAYGVGIELLRAMS